MTRSPITIGIVAHVDAGKTTLAETIFRMAEAGNDRKQDRFLDTDQIERRRGITIYSKVARFEIGDQRYILVDTPGHADFGPEMERALAVMDVCILLVSAPDGVVGYTKTLWSLLNKHQIPTIIFVNKVDLFDGKLANLSETIRQLLSDRILPFPEEESTKEDLAILDEALLDKFVETGSIDTSDIAQLFRRRKFFPLLFGSALQGRGLKDLFAFMNDYVEPPSWPKELSLQVYKTNYDKEGLRLNHIRLTGGGLKPKDIVLDEKIHEIRSYQGDDYEVISELLAGDIATLIGPLNLCAGQTIGEDEKAYASDLHALMHYELRRSDGGDDFALYQALLRLEEEFPDLDLHRKEERGSVFVHLMGRVQEQVLAERLRDQGIEVEFGVGKVAYRETIKEKVVGLGHYEPLKHYAEVRLLLEPAPAGSGLNFVSDVSTDQLAIQWQKQVKRIVSEVKVPGVLTGSSLTDMTIRLVDGRAHNKHTAGGDFLEASIRALRNGLMRGKSVLLEPYYSFELDVPIAYSGRILQDFERLAIKDRTAETSADRFKSSGRGPVSKLQGYFQGLPSLTKGAGRVSYRLSSYEEVEEKEELIQSFAYNPLADEDFSPHSVFTKGGAAVLVPWDQVEDYAHTPAYQESQKESMGEPVLIRPKKRDNFIADDEVDRIFQETFYANANQKKRVKQEESKERQACDRSLQQRERDRVKGPSYLLIDGYNVIYALPSLREMAEENMDAARSLCIDELVKYQSYVDDQIILVFDAYKVKNYRKTIERYGKLVVVYTKLAETADQYIQKTSKEYSKDYQVTVATSDRAEQQIVWGDGAIIRSAEALWQEIFATLDREEENYRKTAAPSLKQGIRIDDEQYRRSGDE